MEKEEKNRCIPVWLRKVPYRELCRVQGDNYHKTTEKAIETKHCRFLEFHVQGEDQKPGLTSILLWLDSSNWKNQTRMSLISFWVNSEILFAYRII